MSFSFDYTTLKEKSKANAGDFVFFVCLKSTQNDFFEAFRDNKEAETIIQYDMNVLFAAVFIACSARLLFVSPEEFLPALLSSASSAAALCMALLSSYCVFCGLSALWEDSGVTAAIAKFLKKPVRALFRSDAPHAAECVCMNVSANLLGLGALATPYGVRAAALMGESESKYRDYSLAVLFTLNAASLQAIPTSVIALRTAAGSLAPSSVVCPILLSSLFFLLTALPVVIFVYKPKEKKKIGRKSMRRKDAASGRKRTDFAASAEKSKRAEAGTV